MQGNIGEVCRYCARHGRFISGERTTRTPDSNESGSRHFLMMKILLRLTRHPSLPVTRAPGSHKRAAVSADLLHYQHRHHASRQRRSGQCEVMTGGLRAVLVRDEKFLRKSQRNIPQRHHSCERNHEASSPFTLVRAVARQVTRIARWRPLRTRHGGGRGRGHQMYT